ncbi:MAG: CHAT domain-containing protein [Planctomycetota bacterium]|nr:MAG: CHAT domain-containing protein [Planctomycetota bacterium]
MAISIRCEECDYRTRIRDELAGKQVACPKCQAVIHVSAATTNSARVPVGESEVESRKTRIAPERVRSLISLDRSHLWVAVCSGLAGIILTLLIVAIWHPFEPPRVPASGPDDVAPAAAVPTNSEIRSPAEPSVLPQVSNNLSPTSPAPIVDDTIRFQTLPAEEPVTTLALTEDQKYLILTHQTANTFSVYDTQARAFVATVKCRSPRSVLCRGQQVFIANHGEGTVSVYSQSQKWSLVATLIVGHPGIMHLSAPCRSYFKNELIVTCHGDGRQASYEDTQIFLLNTQSKQSRKISGASLATVSFDGGHVITQESFNLSSSGGVHGYNYQEFISGKAEPRFQNGNKTPFVLQYSPGSYWVGNNKVVGGSPLTQILEKENEILIPDHSQKIVYSSSGTVLRALRLNVSMSEIGIRRVAYPDPYEDFSKVSQVVYRQRDYLLDHPIAFTQANRLTFFVHCAEGGAVLTAETEAFETPTVPLDEPPAPESTSDNVTNPQPELPGSTNSEALPDSKPEDTSNARDSSFREAVTGSDRFNELVREFRDRRLSGMPEDALVAAEALFEQARSEFGPTDDQYRQSLIWVEDTKALKAFLERVALLQEQQEFQDAVTLGRRVLDLDFEYFGEGHEQTALRTAWLAKINAQLQKQREPFLALQAAASKSRSEGRYEDALKANEQLLNMQRNLLGEDHTSIANVLLRIAQARQALGQAEASIADLEQALRIFKSRLEPDDYRLKDLDGEIRTARWMARCDAKTQRTLSETRLLFSPASQLPVEQKTLRAQISVLEDLRRFVEESSGRDTAVYHLLLVALQSRYERQGDYASAVGAADQALLTSEKLYGKNHPLYIDDLATMFSLGDLTSDPRLSFWSSEGWKTAIELEGVGGSRSLRWAGLRARTLAVEGNPDQAAEVMRSTIPRAKHLFGEVHHTTATAYCLLSEFCFDAGNMAEGKAAAEKGIQLFESLGIVDDSARCRALMGLAYLHQRTEQLDLELSTREDCVATMGRVFGLNSFQCLRERLHLADCWQRKGDHAHALEIAENSVQLLFDSRKELFRGLSEREQLAASQNSHQHLSQYLNLICKGNGNADAACKSVMQWKGAVFLGHLRTIGIADTTEIKDLKSECRARASALQSLIRTALATPDPGLTERLALQQMLTQFDHAHRELSLAQRNLVPDENQTPVLQQVQELIPDGAVLIDFKTYSHRLGWTAEGEPDDEQRLLAFVVRKSGPVQMVQLGPLLPMLESAARWEDQIRRRLPVSKDDEPPEVTLRRQLWDPVDAHIGDTELVIVSPEAFMSSLPLAALPGRRASRYLIEDYGISMVPNAGVLINVLRSKSEKAAVNRENSMLLIGDVDFSPAEGSSDRSTFSSLPGTAVEIQEIAAIHREYFPMDLLTVAQQRIPNEQHFRHAAGQHRFLHLATHGYSMPEEWRDLEPSPQRDLREFIKSAIPDTLNGIILSRAAAPDRLSPELNFDDDGRLTSLEVTMMDLRHVDMTVLSACETTLGMAAEGEGMLGLQRAFLSAGVKSTVTSLWKVDDAATQALMVEFYRNLWEKKMTRINALRQAQLAMLNYYDPNSRVLAARGLSLINPKQDPEANQRLAPYYWASFVLSGDWR